MIMGMMQKAPGCHPALDKALEHLCRVIAIPSFSREESEVADVWEQWLGVIGVGNVERLHNNVYAVAPGFDATHPTLMLNSHLDTVRPVSSYTRDPFAATIEEGRLYGLGSNDAGASGVTLALTYASLCGRRDLPFNLILAITAAEEVMGEQGMRAFLPHLASRGQSPDMVIVGEPTSMQPAIAERGLVVLDCQPDGISGHAARGEGVNAIYRAMEDIASLRSFAPPRESEVLGPVRVSVTMIESGTQHNVVPDRCRYVTDVRTTDAYSNEATVELLRKCVRWSRLEPRSTRVQASVLDAGHPLMRAAVALGLEPYVSPTTSDMALMHGIPSLKIGPGESSRSHSADEYVRIDEIDKALHIYPRLIFQTAREILGNRK